MSAPRSSEYRCPLQNIRHRVRPEKCQPLRPAITPARGPVASFRLLFVAPGLAATQRQWWPVRSATARALRSCGCRCESEAELQSIHRENWGSEAAITIRYPGLQLTDFAC